MLCDLHILNDVEGNPINREPIIVRNAYVETDGEWARLVGCLARRLLEGPDLPVVCEYYTTGDEMEGERTLEPESLRIADGQVRISEYVNSPWEPIRR